jgi:hypothetical protein
MIGLGSKELKLAASQQAFLPAGGNQADGLSVCCEEADYIS